MGNMGGMASMMDKLPGMSAIPAAAKQQVNDKELGRLEAIINSMTKRERKKPDIIKGSRKKRIAAGCGMQIQDVNRLLKQFSQMQKMMKKNEPKRRNGQDDAWSGWQVSIWWRYAFLRQA